MLSLEFYHNAMRIILGLALCALVAFEMLSFIRLRRWKREFDFYARENTYSAVSEYGGSYQRRAMMSLLVLAAAIIISLALGFISLDKKVHRANNPERGGPCDSTALCAKIDSIAARLNAFKHVEIEGPTLKEIVEQIKELDDRAQHDIQPADPGNVKMNTRPSALSLSLIIVGLLTFFLFVAAAFLRPDLSNWKAIGTLSSLLTLSGVALFGIENFQGDFRFFERRIFNGSVPNPMVEEESLLRIGLEHLGAVRNFPVGKHDLFDSADLVLLKDSIIRKQVTVLLLIGEVDRRELKEPAKRIYGSNLSLARARAEHIKTLLTDFCDKNNISVITMNRGALYTGGEPVEQKFSNDRQVVAYGLTTTSH